MDIDQRNAGGPINIVANPNVYLFNLCVDGWRVETHGSMAVTVQQVSDAPPGFQHSLQVTVTTAQSSLNSPDSCMISQVIRGTRVNRLGLGTPGVFPITVAWAVKTHGYSGQCGGTLKNHDGSRTFGHHYNVTAPDTWQLFWRVIGADTQSTWKTDSSLAAWLCFGIGTGSTLQVPDGVWATQNGSNVQGSVNGLAATGNSFQITGVALIPGSTVPTSFAELAALMRLADDEAQICYRRFRRIIEPPLRGGVFSSSVLSRMAMPLSPAMDAKPTPSLGGTLTATDASTITNVNVTGIKDDVCLADTIELNLNYSGGPLTVGQPAIIRSTGTATGYLDLDAEP